MEVQVRMQLCFWALFTIKVIVQTTYFHVVPNLNFDLCVFFFVCFFGGGGGVLWHMIEDILKNVGWEPNSIGSRWLPFYGHILRHFSKYLYVPWKKVIQVWNRKRVMTELLLNYPFNVLIKPQRSSLTNHICFHTLHEVNFSEGYLIIFKTLLTWGQLIEGGYPQSLQQIQRQ